VDRPAVFQTVVVALNDVIDLVSARLTAHVAGVAVHEERLGNEFTGPVWREASGAG
jgi:hypothetical protein